MAHWLLINVSIWSAQSPSGSLGVNPGGFCCLCVLFLFFFKHGCYFLDFLCPSQLTLQDHDEGLTPE